MSAIAGYLGRGGHTRPAEACRAMLAKLLAFGPHSQSNRSLGSATFGRNLYKVLPEDDFDEQPLVSEDARYLFVSDARIDNREEVASALGLGQAMAARMGDAALMLGAWERWGLDCFDHILGDIACAVWDNRAQLLTLARSPGSLKPLFYHAGPKHLAFATMPHGLHTLTEIPKRLNFDEAAAIAARAPYHQKSMIFEGISIVRQGRAVQFADDRELCVRLWNLDRVTPGSIKARDCAEALRSELERSVRAQLRRRGGPPACQLSSGRDSSAVATTAALILRQSNERLIALTGAPQDGYDGGVIGDRLADESELAMKTAAIHSNMIHVICRSRQRDLDLEFRKLSGHHFGPVTNAVALHWAAQVDEEASTRDAQIMLMGSAGNFSISASGLSHFVDVLSNSGAGSWLHKAISIGGLSLSNWRTIGSVSLGPFLPQVLYKGLLRAGGRPTGRKPEVPILRQPYRRRVEQLLLENYFSDPRPPMSYLKFRRDRLLRRDNAEKMSLAISGLDIRDPTSDRRLVETCLSFAPSELVSQAWAPSPIYGAAFADRIPPEVLYNRHRGYQAADWFQLFPGDYVWRLFQQYRKNPLVEALFDYRYIEDLVRSWPREPVSDRYRLQTYRNYLLNALAVAAFIDVHFSD